MAYLRIRVPLCAAVACIGCATSSAQTGVVLHGHVLDSTGAAIPGATVTVQHRSRTATVRSDAGGAYRFSGLAGEAFSLSASAPGFATLHLSAVQVRSDADRLLDLSLSVATQQQQVEVTDDSARLSVDPADNASALVLRGAALDALSDDPNGLVSQLEALAGPAAGPNGGQIYIDGFTGGQLPPKSSIREIRINRNPFSAEFERIGYGRIEILTKPGSEKFTGHIFGSGISSAFNTGNPLVPGEPSYYFTIAQADVQGPLRGLASYAFSFQNVYRGNQSAIVAVDPSGAGTLRQLLPNPSTQLYVSPRFDLQLGNRNTLSVKNTFTRNVITAAGVGGLRLASQAYNVDDEENALQVVDTNVVNNHLLTETRFQWRRIRKSQTPSSTTPALMTVGAFTGGGNVTGLLVDHQDALELQHYWTTTLQHHLIRFGTRLRLYRDTNEATTGSNGNYLFADAAQYNSRSASQYQATVVRNAVARADVFDGALFYQDDWRARPYLLLSYGLRYEGQNRIHDKADWAPRLALAWAPNAKTGTAPRTVLRAGYGWFYDRFTVPNFFTAPSAAPYVIQAIHQNGSNGLGYVVNQPNFFAPTAPASEAELQAAPDSRTSVLTLDPHFHAALSMQGGLGVDRKLGSKTTINITWLNTRGLHQYLTNTPNAPAFNAVQYRVTGSVPLTYDNQFQSGGVFNENQLIATVNTTLGKFSLQGNYTFSNAHSNTTGVTFTPSVPQNPGLDYGRASFSIHHRTTLIGSYALPFKIVLAPVLIAQSGTPYNVTLGSDATGNTHFNARPTFSMCGVLGVIQTEYGCLDSMPAGKGERIVPFNLATGPANMIVDLRISKVVGIGPHVETAARGNLGSGSGSGTALGATQARPNTSATVPRRYSLTFAVAGFNIFNQVNRGVPNGVLNSPLFGTSQTLAGGPFALLTSGNRNIFLQSLFSF